MEAIAALGVISSIISVVDLAGTLVVTTKDLLHSASDALPQNVWLEELAERHKALANDLQQTTCGVGPLGKTDADLAKLAHRCLKESSDLLKVLQKLKVPARQDGTKSKLSAVKFALKTMYKNSDIGSKRKKLADLESQLSVLLLHAIRTTQLAGFDELRDIVDSRGRDAITVVRESHDSIAEKIRQLQNSSSHVEQGLDRIEQHQLNAQEQQRVADLLSSLAYENMMSRKEMIADPIGSTFDWAFEDYKQENIIGQAVGIQWGPGDDEREGGEHEVSKREDSEHEVSEHEDSEYEDSEYGTSEYETSEYEDSEHEGYEQKEDERSLKRWLDGALTHFWVSGNPGTGKSVFMKSLRLDPRTALALQAWAGIDRLLMLDHYFWIAGTAMQRSWRAMLQHLCYEAIEQYNDLAQVAFPTQWQDRMSLRGRSWTTAMLIEALKRIFVMPHIKVCIILDGLDECEDRNRKEMLRMINELAGRANLKLCVSSRPWIEFEKSFQTWSKVNLPKNTKWDIFQLVCTRLRSADEQTYQGDSDDLVLFGLICKQSASARVIQALKSPKRLVHAICRKANGNTLWATLILDTICERLPSGEDPEQLTRFVQEAPAGLDDYYFQLVYSRIHETYRTGQVSETAMILKIVCLQSSLPGRGYECLWALLRSLRSTGGIAHDHRFAISRPVTEDETPYTQQAHFAVHTFVTSRCKDLLTTYESYDYGSGCFEVAFAHRSIYDFVRSARMQALLDIQIPRHFKHPDFALQLMLLSTIMAVAYHIGSDVNPFYAGEMLVALCTRFQEYRLMDWPVSDKHSASVFDASHDAGTLWVQRYATRLSNRLRHVMVELSLELACADRTLMLDELVRAGSREDISHVISIPSESLQLLHIIIGCEQQPVRQVIHCHQAVPSKSGASNLPAAATISIPVDNTWWIIAIKRSLVLGIASRSRYSKEDFTILVNAFLRAGASLDLDVCVGVGRCYGPICVCAKSPVHNRMYECPGGGISKHKHDWRSARNFVLEYTGIGEEKLDDIIHSRKGAEDDAVHERLLAHAVEVEAEWQRLQLVDDSHSS